MLSLFVTVGCACNLFNTGLIRKPITPSSDIHSVETKHQSKYQDDGGQNKTVYRVKNELELTKVVQMNIDKGIKEICFQSDRPLDFKQVINYISYLNPFDVSITTTPASHACDPSSQSCIQELAITNLDTRYDEALVKANAIEKTIILPDMDNDERIKAIHDYIVENTAYDEAAAKSKNDPSVYDAAGVLVDGDAVCTGYSRAFMMLAKLANVPAIYVASDQMNHSWNLVYGNDGWRYIDVTWDDPIPNSLHRVHERFLTMSIKEFIQEGSHHFDDTRSSDFYLSFAKNIFG